MRAVILAGGKGSRLLPYTAILPKPLMPVGDRPILEILIRQLEKSGFHRLTISLGHLAPLVQAVLNGNGHDRLKAKIEYSIEATPLGTGGPLSLIDGLDETFLVTNGDVLTDLDLQDLLRFHRSEKAQITIAAHQRKVFIDYGVLSRVGHVLKKYEEKPTIDYEVSMGIYVLEPEVLRHIRPGTYVDFPDLVQILLDQGEKVSIFPFDGIWYDLGREEDFRSVQSQWKDLKENFA